MEAYRAGVENKIYICKTKFDTEFSLYRELTRVFFDAVKSISVMIPYRYTTVPADEEVRKKFEEENYLNAVKAVILAQDTLNSNIPFISKEFYKDYSDILSECQKQINVFEERWNKRFIGHKFGESTLEGEDYKRTKTIKNKLEVLNDKIREYISSLDVIE